MSQVAESVAVHTLGKLFLAFEEHLPFQELLVLIVPFVLVDDEFQLRAKGHIEALARWIDHLIEDDACLVWLLVRKLSQLGLEQSALLVIPEHGLLPLFTLFIVKIK